ncbi:MAG: AraC family transcriptional regulator [Polyangiaceae bacterium]
MSALGTVSVGHFRALTGALERVGVDVGPVLAALGVSPANLTDPDGRIAANLAFAVFEDVARLTGDEAFGLHAAEALPSGAFGIIEYVTRSSRDMREGLERLARYYGLVNERVQLELTVKNGIARFAIPSSIPNHIPRQLRELLVASLVLRGRAFTGRDWPMRAIHFVGPAPADTREHVRVLKAPVLFGQPVEALMFDASWLDQPYLTAEPALASMLDRHAQLLLAKLPVSKDFLGDVRTAIAESLRGRDPSLELTAERLHLSSRTVQRRLQELDTSHQALVEAVRRDLAQRFLATGELSIGEMAYMLGFARTSAFHRAFKRWTGTTPADYKSKTVGARGKLFGVKGK